MLKINDLSIGLLLQAPAILVSLGDWNMHFLVVIETEYFVTSCWSNVSHFHWFQEKKSFIGKQ